MQHMIDDVRLFHKNFGHPSATIPVLISERRRSLRRSLIAEEMGEMWTAATHHDMVEFADGLADSLYVLTGTLIEYGLRLFLIQSRPYRARRAPAFPGKNRIVAMKADLALALSAVFVARDLKAIERHINFALNLLIGIAHECAIPIEKVWAEVQRSNMSKMESASHRDGCDIRPGEKCNCGAVLYRDDGKILKGSGYSPPDVAGILRAAGWVPVVERPPVKPF